MLRSIAILVLVLTPHRVLACKCLAIYPVCQAVAASDLVFIGTVDSIETVYKAPPNAGEKMSGEVVARRAQLRVRTIFRSEEEGDKDTDEDLDDADPAQIQKEITVWTGSDDCGVDFQAGETYLIYAVNDEETGHIESSICYKTRRLSDAGTDLSYLDFCRRSVKTSSRVEGSVVERKEPLTPSAKGGDGTGQLGAFIVRLEWQNGVRFTQTEAGGYFVFDGLAPGDYQLTVFDKAFPRVMAPLSRSERIVVQPARLRYSLAGCGTFEELRRPASQHAAPCLFRPCVCSRFFVFYSHGGRSPKLRLRDHPRDS